MTVVSPQCSSVCAVAEWNHDVSDSSLCPQEQEQRDASASPQQAAEPSTKLKQNLPSPASVGAAGKPMLCMT